MKILQKPSLLVSIFILAQSACLATNHSMEDSIPSQANKTLLKTLKASAGTGGTLKDGLIELQGDQVSSALEALTKAGYRPKQAGG